MFADDETEVEVDHVRAMPNAQLAVLPGTGHGLPADKPDLFNLLSTDFLMEVTP